MRILLSAYACAPGEGSEPEVGWGWAQSCRAAGWSVSVVTRSNNLPALPQAAPDLRFAGFDLSQPWLALKRLSGGVGLRVYYWLWQSRLAGQPLGAEDADIMQHVTLAGAAVPAGISALPSRAAFVWGPVGGGDDVPWRFLPGLGWRGASSELARVALRALLSFAPALRATARKSALALASTPATAWWLRRLGASRVAVLSQAALSPEDIAALAEHPLEAVADKPLRLVAVGEVTRRKGLHLALDALARLDTSVPWTLDVIGAGREQVLLQQKSEALGLGGRVQFRGALPRHQVLAELGTYHALLHLSLRDSAGFSCAEAMAAGLAVICLDHGGPAQLVPAEAGVLIEPRSPEDVARAVVARLMQWQRQPDLLLSARHMARAHAQENLSWAARHQRYVRLLRAAGLLNAGGLSS